MRVAHAFGFEVETDVVVACEVGVFADLRAVADAAAAVGQAFGVARQFVVVGYAADYGKRPEEVVVGGGVVGVVAVLPAAAQPDLPWVGLFHRRQIGVGLRRRFGFDVFAFGLFKLFGRIFVGAVFKQHARQIEADIAQIGMLAQDVAVHLRGLAQPDLRAQKRAAHIGVQHGVMAGDVVVEAGNVFQCVPVFGEHGGV